MSIFLQSNWLKIEFHFKKEQAKLLFPCNIESDFYLQVNALSVIGGCKGNGEAKKVIHKVFEQLMTPALLSAYTWSGRGAGKSRKFPFKNYLKIHQLIFTVLNKVQSKYSLNECEEDIKKRVLKYAYLKSDSEPSRANPVSSDESELSE